MLLGTPEAQSLGGTGGPKAALEQLDRSGIGAAPLAPIEVLTPAARADDTAARMATVDGVPAASPPRGARRADADAVVEVLPRSDTTPQPGRKAVAAVRAAAGLPSTTVGGGTGDWQHGVGTELLFGVGPSGSVLSWAPVIVFAFIYGLSTDYEVFISPGCAKSTTAPAPPTRRSCAGSPAPGGS
jgi:hypothetical protein